MRICVLIVLGLAAGLALLAPAAAPAQEAGDFSARVAALNAAGFDRIEAAVQALAATGDDRAVPVLEALSEGDLQVRKSDGAVVIARKSGRDLVMTLAATGAALGPAGRGDLDKIKVNNRLRRAIRAALGGLTLRAPDPAKRLAAAAAVFKSRDAEMLEALQAGIAAETVPEVLRAMVQARASVVLAADRPEADKIEAVRILGERGDQDALAMLGAVPAGEPEAVREAAVTAIAAIQSRLALWSAGQNVWYGISLGSVLLLAAIGLAITFGVMGVINMAHGEMVMLGAYTTFVVQEVIRNHAPHLFDLSLVIALPLAFLVAGLAGVVIERGVIRFLYGRPLETLLATWGLSLIIQQAVRTAFGPTNQEVGNPSWMSGAFSLGHLTITYSRLWIVVFSLAVLGALMLVLKRTPLGLQMRAVTQNRAMAASMGIRTDWIDALTFGLGSGIAGIAGLALSQIDNVSPNLGQSYIIDSFMVVVFGGVGNLWGTLVGAMSLGVANKFLEPYAGAVVAKIVVLVLIILFIQRRPRGLFALRGRAVEP